MESMTGYGAGTAQSAEAEVSIQIKSVNARYLDLFIKGQGLPPMVESAIREKVRAGVGRGRLDVLVDVRWNRSGDASLNEEAVTLWKQRLDAVAAKLKLQPPEAVRDLLSLPGVVESGASGESRWEGLRDTLQVAVDAALASLQAMRRAEGKALAAVFEERMNGLAASLERIAGLREQCRTQSLERMRTKLGEILAGVHVDENRLLQEAAWWVNRTEIAEEVDRFRSHIQQFRQACQEGPGIGKRLDFIIQEMNREINTILSKSDLTALSQEGIFVKAELEKVREQVQNID